MVYVVCWGGAHLHLQVWLLSFPAGWWRNDNFGFGVGFFGHLVRRAMFLAVLVAVPTDNPNQEQNAIFIGFF